MFTYYFTDLLYYRAQAYDFGSNYGIPVCMCAFFNAMFYTFEDIHVPQRMNPNDFQSPLLFLDIFLNILTTTGVDWY